MDSAVLKLLRTEQSRLEVELAGLQAQLADVKAELDRATAAIRAAQGNVFSPTGGEASVRSVEHHRRTAHPDIQGLTFKQLIRKALHEHFTNGATANELLDFFRKEWGRIIMRTSLSPQLSRLRQEGKIELRGKVWHLSRNENEPPQGTPEDGSETALDAQTKEATE